MFGAGKNMHRLYGVALYLGVVLVLYGRKEILPRAVIKHYNNDNALGLKAAKRDPKQAINYDRMLYDDVYSKGGMFAQSKIMKPKGSV